jgi:Putative amidoligase enzyme
MILPPCVANEEGSTRRVGAEIEFGGIACERAAELVRDLFGGSVAPVDPYKYEVTGTRFGRFEVELDSQYAHTKLSGSGPADAGRTERRTLKDEVKEGLTTAFAEVARLWLPIEIVCPPVPIDRLPELDAIPAALRAAGAEGTDDALIYAFATQFNPEAPSLQAPSLLRHLKAFLLLAKSLRARVDPDLVRRALPFAQPFPLSYAVQVVAPQYQPDMPQLVADYIEANPTRNRELDMLPLFAHVAPDAVFSKLEDVRIKPRPAFHYRLPDTKLSDPDWGLIVEWNRWVEVERLAADEEALERLGEAFIRGATGRTPSAFAEAIEAWRVREAVVH